VDPRGQGALDRVWRASAAATVRLGNFSPHNTLYYFNMMTRAMPGNSSLYFEVNCPECKKCIDARYSFSRVGCVGWLVEQEGLSEGVCHANAGYFC
jgi:hypothetical protein